MMEQPGYLLEPSFLRQLDRLQITSRRMASGARAGKRRSRHMGSSIEFADYRAYAPGDDLRQLDWNAYARTGKLFVKRFMDETDMHVSLYIDCSKSMDYGTPTKLSVAVRLAAALGYLSLHQFDYVSVFAIDGEVRSALRSLHGKGKVQSFFDFLSRLQPDGRGDLQQALTSGSAIHGKAGVSLVFSDFLFERGVEEGLSYLQAAHQEVILIHLLAAEERNPSYEGELRLIDSETGDYREIAMSPRLVDEYQVSMQAYQKQLASYAFGRGMHYVTVHAEDSLETILFRVFQQAGIIR
ncbi:DUF58 domain-containing protein [Brevibacillus migulae]|uniref:DUF58 domain-containing protein n=1 Tax=Brevibacillus migulae TaxID=1644114 RepID=UPI001F184332|nr:DUF58 domain-containing protein [Brevibacillus migulae]